MTDDCGSEANLDTPDQAFAVLAVLRIKIHIT